MILALLMLAAPLWASRWEAETPAQVGRSTFREIVNERGPEADTPHVEVTLSHQGTSVLKAPEFAGETMPPGRGLHDLTICNYGTGRVNVDPMAVNAAIVADGIATSPREMAQIALGRTRSKGVAGWKKALAQIGAVGIPTASGAALGGAINANPYLAGAVGLAMYLIPKLSTAASEEIQATKRPLNAVEGVTWLSDMQPFSLNPGCIGKIVVFGSFDLNKPTRKILVRGVL